ncbi:DgyrCDS3216 [Dimorphilus gyrociliatus]|uniref:DgyrCDS3216 n=1 Tax=Dimorphilus gyrociliatus TaxID=2664684 RepID=A0A7I8VFA8_9ANNE|nr:DgyrCDS3216 [Dimorphilus gyrociliatus]
MLSFKTCYKFIKISTFLLSCECFIEEKDNIARSRPAYQFTTQSDQHLAKYAVSSDNNLSNYAEDRKSVGWLTIDLGGYYSITEICFWNSQPSGFLRNFQVFAEIHLLDEEELCFSYPDEVVSNPIRSKSSYICRSCNCKGSFLRLKKLHSDYFALTDMTVRGTYVKQSDDMLYNLTTSLIHFGKEKAVKPLVLSDGLFNTHVFKDKELNSEPFLRIDMTKSYDIKTVLFDNMAYDDPDILKMYVYLRYFPETINYPADEILGYVDLPYKNYFTTHVVKSLNYKTGRYLLFKTTCTPGKNNFLQISNVYIYCKTVSIGNEMKWKPTLKNDMITSIDLAGNAISKTIHNGNFIKSSESINLKSNDMLKINIEPTLINYYCIKAPIDSLISNCDTMRLSKITIPQSILNNNIGIGITGVNVKINDIYVIGNGMVNSFNCEQSGIGYSKGKVQKVYLFTCKTKVKSIDIMIFNPSIVLKGYLVF